MIHLHHVSRRFSATWAVRDVSFSVNVGEVVGLLGNNGAGKTTTLRMLTGELWPSQGAVQLGNEWHPADNRSARALIGYAPEGAPAYEDQRVDSFLRRRARDKGVPRNELNAAVEHCMATMGITDARSKRIGVLSKGYRQRVSIADALVNNPPIVVLDEPTSGLDPSQVKHFRDVLQRLRTHHAVLLSTHVLNEVAASCDRYVLLHHGEVASEGQVTNVDALEAVFESLSQKEAS